MKNSILLVLSLLVAMAGFHCANTAASSGGLTVEGTIASAGGMTVHLEKIGINPVTNTSQPMGTANADAAGKFKMAVPNKLSEGWYRLRIGEQRVNLIFDGSESNLTVNGNLGMLNQFQYELTGSTASLTYRNVMQKAVARQIQVADIANFADTTANPLTAVAVTTHTMANHPQSIPYHQKALEKLEKKYPGSTNLEEYKAFVGSIQQQQMAAGGAGAGAGATGYQFIEAAQRQMAADIKLPSPTGKEYSLSSLKGKVVLLDFWASWCGPCRRENPNVVNIYKKYKDRGFTVFSVSLDGLDARQAASLGNDAAQLKQAKESQKKRWMDAIAQ
ncbi:MAG: TlpA disulfide reductase family protein, partial [Bacteroidota bacterium]